MQEVALPIESEKLLHKINWLRYIERLVRRQVLPVAGDRQMTVV
jgi:hypothetical protein